MMVKSKERSSLLDKIYTPQKIKIGYCCGPPTSLDHTAAELRKDTLAKCKTGCYILFLLRES